MFRRGWVVCSILMSVTLVAFSTAAEVRFHESRAWQRAKVVAPGQQVWSFQTSYQKISDRFSADGRTSSLGKPYGRTVTWRQLLQAESPSGRADLQNYMNQNGLKDSDVAAQASYKLEREDLGLGLDWAYGLTRRWMIGFQVPLVYRQTRVSSKVELTPQLAQGVGQTNQKSSTLAFNEPEIRGKVRELAEAQLVNSGYDNVPDQQSSWEFGDISLMSQISVYENYKWNWGVQQFIRFPTARNQSISDYFQTSSNEGQVDLGLTSLLDYRMKRWTVGTKLGYVVQLPDSIRQRVPSRSSSEASSDIDPKIYRDLGDWVWGAVDGEYRMNRRLDLTLEYAVLFKSRDRYAGESRSGVNYESLSDNTQQELHQTRAGFLYRLSAPSARSGVENKWMASLGYTYPWIGRNSVDASRTSLELISYF